MQLPNLGLKFGLVAFGAMLMAAAANAQGSVPLTPDVANAVTGPVQVGEHVVVPSLALDDGSTVSLDLEAFDVFAAGADLVEYTPHGPRRLAAPADRYFRGTVIGDPDSVVVLVSGVKLRGFVYTNKRLYAIAPDGDVYADNLPGSASRLRRVDPELDRPAGMPPFHCDVESVPPPLGEGMSAGAFGAPISVQPMWTSTVYTVNLAIETDYELYTKFGSSTDSELRFIGDLTAAASAIYWRDVKTVFKIGTVHLWSTSADPWTATDTSSALSEMLTYWTSNYTSVQRTIVHMLSGKNMGGGIAYIGVLCNFGYGYGLSSSLDTTFSLTNPALYWDVICYTHEMGHNFSSPHTECYTPPVDTCTPCDTFSCTGSVPAGGGTLMSYCHACSGGYSNIILYFGLNGTVSQPVLDQMRGYVESKAACLGPLAAAPTVTGIFPTSGSTAGGTPVTISGTGFQGFATVTLGGTAKATGVTIVDSTTITATTAAHLAGTVSVVVQNPDSQTATKTSAYTYGTPPPAPAVTGVSPGFGTTAGGTAIAITGSNFVAGATVTLGGSAAAVGTVSATSITATTASHAAGFVNVVVTNPDTQSGTLTNGYEYRVIPVGADFYTVAPCRVVDTRASQGFTGAFGAPALVGGVSRSFPIPSTATCAGISATAVAYSFNVTVVAPAYPYPGQYLTLYPTGGTLPVVSTLNFNGGEIAANAAIVPAGTSGSIDVWCTAGVNLVIDINGYFQ